MNGSLKLVIVAVNLSLLLAAATACSSSTTPDLGIKAVTTVDRMELHAGDIVNVSTSFTNTGTVDRVVAANRCPEQFEVKTPTGVVVGPGSRVCSAVAITRTLAAGETVTFIDQWNGDGKPAAGTDNNQPLLPAGTYVLVPRAYALPNAESAAAIRIVP